MDTDGDSASGKPSPTQRLRSGRNANTPLLPEIDAYLHLLVLLYLLDLKRYPDAVKCAGSSMSKFNIHFINSILL